jgi:hypothetical protein
MIPTGTSGRKKLMLAPCFSRSRKTIAVQSAKVSAQPRSAGRSVFQRGAQRAGAPPGTLELEPRDQDEERHDGQQESGAPHQRAQMDRMGGRHPQDVIIEPRIAQLAQGHEAVDGRRRRDQQRDDRPRWPPSRDRDDRRRSQQQREGRLLGQDRRPAQTARRERGPRAAPFEQQRRRREQEAHEQAVDAAGVVPELEAPKESQE